MQADHPSSVALDVLCICGAPYERSEKIVSVRDFDSAICEFCGTGLANVVQFSHSGLSPQTARPRQGATPLTSQVGSFSAFTSALG